MSDFKQFTAKTEDEAISLAMLELGVSSDRLEIEVIDKGSAGLLGIGSRPVVIRARKKKEPADYAIEFLTEILNHMGIYTELKSNMNFEEQTLEINISGDEMGLLIGKRGQTLDSLQYLVSLVLNKHCEEYLRVKLDTENYREKRKTTLENLAKNIAYKVRRTKKNISLEPMNPYERRIIHAALQNDKFVYTKSEGEEPYRHVMIILKREQRFYNKKPYNRNNAGRKNNSMRSEGYSNDYKREYAKYRKERSERLERDGQTFINGRQGQYHVYHSYNESYGGGYGRNRMNTYNAGGSGYNRNRNDNQQKGE